MGEESFHSRNSQNNSQDANSNNSGTEDLEGLTENLGINEEALEDATNEEDLTPEEFQRLDHQLDQLFSALDDIESKNDNIHSQLLLLLQENREIRKQLQEHNEAGGPPDKEPALKTEASG